MLSTPRFNVMKKIVDVVFYTQVGILRNARNFPRKSNGFVKTTTISFNLTAMVNFCSARLGFHTDNFVNEAFTH